MLASLLLMSSLWVHAPLQVIVKKIQQPVAKQAVEVIGFEQGQKVFSLSQSTDASGSARFSVPSNRPVNVVVSLKYEGLAYNSDVFTTDSVPTKPLIMTVYPTQALTKELRIEEGRFFFDVKEEFVLVEQTLVVNNPTYFAVTGTKDQAGKSHLLTIQLPPNLFDFRPISFFEENDWRLDDNVLEVVRPVWPGKTEVSFRYALKPKWGSLRFSQGFMPPIESLSLSTSDPSIRLLAPQPLNPVGQKLLNGRNILLYSEVFPTPQTAIELKVENLPSSMNPLWVFPPVAFLIFLSLAWFRKNSYAAS